VELRGATMSAARCHIHGCTHAAEYAVETVDDEIQVCGHHRPVERRERIA